MGLYKSENERTTDILLANVSTSIRLVPTAKGQLRCVETTGQEREVLKEQYDFSELTERQQGLLTFAGWMADSFAPKPSKKTVAVLIERELLIPSKRKTADGICVLEYTVPTPVHMAWCEHCAKSETT